jgi:hypothetical protein
MFKTRHKQLTDEHRRLLNDKKFDRTNNRNESIDHDASYRQLIDINAQTVYNRDELPIRIIIKYPLYLFFFVFLILTSHSNALPLAQSLSSKSSQCTL